MSKNTKLSIATGIALAAMSAGAFAQCAAPTITKFTLDTSTASMYGVVHGVIEGDIPACNSGVYYTSVKLASNLFGVTPVATTGPFSMEVAINQPPGYMSVQPYGVILKNNKYDLAPEKRTS